jgi:hypothetical protein
VCGRVIINHQCQSQSSVNSHPSCDSDVNKVSVKSLTMLCVHLIMLGQQTPVTELAPNVGPQLVNTLVD